MMLPFTKKSSAVPAKSGETPFEMGSATVPVAVSGVSPDTFKFCPEAAFSILNDFQARCRRRDGDDCVRDARSPRESVLFQSSAGFTMVEIALCLAIIGFALVAIIGVLPIGMSTQKDNREETLINFDANYLMNAIRSGSPGPEDLTNFIVAITNTYTHYGATSNILDGPHVSWFTTSAYSIGGGAVISSNILNYGSNIVALLSTPRFTQGGGNGDFVSNYVTGDFRAISGSPVDQGTNQPSRDFAFTYRVIPEIMRSTVGPLFTNNLPTNQMNNLMSAQQNFAEIRLSFRWPVVGGGALGPSKAVYRSAGGGQITNFTYANTAAQFYLFVPGGGDTTNTGPINYLFQ
jgi:type II secretory pathway pseudopilin PulG